MQKISEKLTKAKALIEMAIIDAEKFESGNNAAGTRLRKTAQVVAVGMKEIRQGVLEVRKS